MIRGSIYSKESLKSACKLKRESGKMQLNKKFRTDGVLLSVERWSFISIIYISNVRQRLSFSFPEL